MIARLLLALVSLLAVGAVAAHKAAPLAPFSADYEVWHEGKLQGESTLSLERLGGDRWRYRLQARGTSGLARLSGFTADQTTEFSLHDGRPRIERTVARRKALWSNREVIAEFDWRAGEVRWSGDVAKDRRGAQPLPPGSTNGHLLNLLLALDAARLAPGQSVEYPMWERGRQRPTRYVAGRPESLDTELGEKRAIPMVEKHPSKPRRTTAWYAPGDTPTPLRVLQTENGQPRLELRLLRVSP